MIDMEVRDHDGIDIRAFKTRSLQVRRELPDCAFASLKRRIAETGVDQDQLRPRVHDDWREWNGQGIGRAIGYASAALTCSVVAFETKFSTGNASAPSVMTVTSKSPTL